RKAPPTRRSGAAWSPGEPRPEARRFGPPDDGVGEDDVGETDAEVGHDHAPAGRADRPVADRLDAPGRPVEDRLAERGRRVRVVVEVAGLAVRDELAAVVDEEDRGVARH